MDEKRLLFIDIKATPNNSTAAQTNQTSLGKRLWNPSDNSFTFNFSENSPTFNFFSENSPAPKEETPSSYWNLPPPDKASGLTHSTEQDSGFSFNFLIPPVTSEDMTTDTASPPALSGLCLTGDETCAKEENPSNSPVTNPTSEPSESSKGKKKKKSGKANSSGCAEAQQTPITTEASDADKGTLTAEQQLQRELDWCIDQLELGMKTQKSTSKQKEDASRALKTLRSSKAPLAKKRQVMRAMAGDYRKAMEVEKDKQYKLIQNAMTAAQVKAVSDSSKKSVFHRRAEVKTETNDCTATKSEQETLQTGAQAPNTSTHPQGEASHFVLTPSKEEFCFNFL